MMNSESIERSIVYFSTPGKANTSAALTLAKKRADELGIKTVLVASTGGETGLAAMKLFKGQKVIVVSHMTGMKEPNLQELTPETRQQIEKDGGTVLTTVHAFAGVARAVRMQLNTYEVPEIMASTLRIFGQGMKVVCELALMAADAGLVRTDEDVISIGGTGRGADTAAVVRPVNSQNFFDMKVKEIICKPRL
jgi:uncharacterized protein